VNVLRVTDLVANPEYLSEYPNISLQQHFCTIKANFCGIPSILTYFLSATYALRCGFELDNREKSAKFYTLGLQFLLRSKEGTVEAKTDSRQFWCLLRGSKGVNSGRSWGSRSLSWRFGCRRPVELPGRYGDSRNR